MVAPDVVDVVSRPLVRLWPVREALEEFVGLLVDQLQPGPVLLLILGVPLDGRPSLVNVGPAVGIFDLVVGKVVKMAFSSKSLMLSLSMCLPDALRGRRRLRR